MTSVFHLSIAVKSIKDSIDFFVGLLGGSVSHQDASGYVNIEVLGSQITLKEYKSIKPELPDFHFGFNMSMNDFNQLAQQILKRAHHCVYMEPRVVDAGTALERKKMYLKCPTGYLIELKGY